MEELNNCLNNMDNQNNFDYVIETIKNNKISEIDYIFKYYKSNVNQDKAMEFYKKIIDIDNHYTINKLADMYNSGNGIKSNCEEAVKLYKKAMLLGNLNSIYSLAVMHLNGFGCKKEIYVKQLNYIKNMDC